MQLCNITVRLNGDANNTVRKEGVTPAEIVILRDLHGPGSVTDIQPTEMNKAPHVHERSRLAMTYGEHVVDRIFPGQFTKLPVSLKDIDMIEGDEAEEVEQTQQTEQTEQTGDSEDDKILRIRIEAAPSKVALREIAAEEEIDLTGIADKMEDLKAAIIKGAFSAEAK